MNNSTEQSLGAITKTLQGVNRWIGRMTAWGMLAMVVVTFVVVVLRYVFGVGWVWLQQCAVYIHAMTFLMGAGYTLQRNAHVRVDIVYREVSSRRRALIDACGAVCLLLPMCVVLFVESWPYVLSSWAVFEGAQDSGGLDAVYFLKSFILLYCLLLAFQGVVIVLQSMQYMRGRHD